MRKFRSDSESFDRQFKLFGIIFWIIFGIAAVGVISMIVLQVFIGVKIAQDPNGVAEQAGSLLKTFLDSAGVK